VVVGLFAPADEQAAEAVEPGVGAFDDPAARAEAFLAFDLFLLFTAGADMPGEAELVEQLVDLGIVVALVQAQALGRLRGGVRTVDHDALQGRTEQLEVVYVRAGDLEPDREAVPVAENGPLGPFFALSVGFGPVFSPPNGAFPIAPSHDNHSHSIPFNWS